MPSVEDGNKKIIRDPVHGYVEIGNAIVKDIIDTPAFQRLIRIQQTNLSVLYPSATHTRFEHSIGVFFLGKFIFYTICENSHIITDKNTFKEKYRNTFLLACLLHDIGHAPLSHTGEVFFEKDKLLTALETKGVSLKSTKPAEHEVMSCLVALDVFERVLSNHQVDKDLFCRMITGVEYSSINNETAIKNILIRLLNSSFDVDKMDYIMRDSMSAGIGNLTLDIYRIAHALSIFEDNGMPRLAFQKVGFSVVNNIINNRNYLYYWLYGHHKVQYHSHILKRYIKELTKSPEFGEEFKKIFSIDAITHPSGISITIPSGTKTIKYIDDIDILSIMKEIPNHKSEFKIYYDQIFSRDHYSPFWKTKIDFDEKVKNSITFSENVPNIIARADDPIHNIEPKIATLFKENGVALNLGEFYIFNREFKLAFPDFEEKIYFYVPGATPPFKKYSKLFSSLGTIPISEIQEKMFFVFLRKEKLHQKENFIKILENQTIS